MDYRTFQYVSLLLIINSNGYGIIDTMGMNVFSAPSARKPVQLAPGVCADMVLKKVAKCNNKDLEFVPSDLPIDIQQLHIAHNYIQKLTKTSFNRYLLLNHLDLSHNQISVIAAETFKLLRFLTYLDLSSNPNLNKLDNNLFKWSTRLLSLKLMTSGLQYFPDNIMEMLPNLELLDLRRNNLTSIHFKSCPVFNPNASIRLHDNQISAITLETFPTKCSFKEVLLGGNPVLSVSFRIFQNLKITHADPDHLFLAITIRRIPFEFAGWYFLPWRNDYDSRLLEPNTDSSITV